MLFSNCCRITPEVGRAYSLSVQSLTAVRHTVTGTEACVTPEATCG
jgi:hypothetical protein